MVSLGKVIALIESKSESQITAISNINDFIEQEFYNETVVESCYESFTKINGQTVYQINYDMNGDVNTSITDGTKIINNLNYITIQNSNNKPIYKQGFGSKLLNQIVEVVSFNPATREIALNFEPSEDFVVKYLYKYAKKDVPSGKMDIGLSPVQIINNEASNDANEISYDNSISKLESTNIQDAIDELVTTANYDSIGIIVAPTISSNGDGTLTISSDGSYLLAKSNTLESMLTKVENVTGDTLTPTDSTINFVYVDYNSASPIYGITTDLAYVTSDFTRCPVVRVIREGITLHFEEYDLSGILTANKLLIKDIRVKGFERSEGLVLSTSETRIATLTGGKVWFGIQTYDMPTISTGGSGVSTYEYYLVGGVWNKSSNVSLFDSTYYSDGMNRQTLLPSKYVAKYFFRDVGSDNELYYIHGNQYTSLTLAQNEVLPSVPSILSAHAIYVGKIVIQQGAILGVAFTRTWGETLQSSVATNHEDLSNIQQAGSGITNGHISVGTQTIYGEKTFNSSIHANDGVNSAYIFPTTDSASAVSITKADKSTKVIEIDTLNSKLIVNGSIEFTGTIDELNVTNMQVEDVSITINNGGTDSSSDGAGIIIDRPSGDKSILYNNTKDVFDINSAISVVGIKNTSGVSELVSTITTNTTLDSTYNIILCNSTSAITITLPQASSDTYRQYKIKNINTGIVTIDGYSGETIDGNTTLTISNQYDAITLVNDGSAWYIL